MGEFTSDQHPFGDPISPKNAEKKKKKKRESRSKSRSKSPGRLASTTTTGTTTTKQRSGSLSSKDKSTLSRRNRSKSRSKSPGRLASSNASLRSLSPARGATATDSSNAKAPKTPKSAGYNTKKKKLSKKLLSSNGNSNNNNNNSASRPSWWSLALDEDELLLRKELELADAEKQRLILIRAKHDLEKHASISKGLVAQRLQEAKTSSLATATVRDHKPTLFTNHKATPLFQFQAESDPVQSIEKIKQEFATKFDAPNFQKDAQQKTLVKETAKNHFLLKDLAKGAKIDMKKLVKAFEPLEVEKGQPIVKEGEQGQHFFILQEGSVTFQTLNKTKSGKTTSEETTTTTLHAGETFGDQNLLFQAPEQATIVAANDDGDDDDDEQQQQPDTINTVNSMDVSVHSFATSHTKLLRLNQKDFRGLVLTTEQAEEDRKKAAVKQAIEEKKASAVRRPGAPAAPVKRKPWYENPAVQEESRALVAALDKYAPSVEDLDKINVLGEGQFGEVWLVAPKKHPDLGGIPPPKPQSQHEFALKVQALVPDGPGAEEVIRNELQIMKELVHYPFVSKLYKTYEEENGDEDDEENPHTVDMLLGLIPGGELWDVVHQECEETGEWLSGIPEPHAQFYTLLVADTLGFLHSQGILFRDLKPENIMIDADGYPLIVDFGFAKKLKPHEKTYTFCGTPNYVAPEIIKNRGQTKAVDYWALGIVIYEMVSGENPFFYDGLSEMELFEAICEEKPEPLSSKKFSKAVRELIKELLHKDPTQRLGMDGIDDIVDHNWFHRYSLSKMRMKAVKAPWVPGKDDKAGAQHLTNGGLAGVEEESDDELDEEEIAKLELARKLIAAEEEAAKKEREDRLKLEEEIAALERQEEARRQAAAQKAKAEQEASRLKAQQEAARLKAEKEAAEEAARIEAEEEAARLKAEEEAAEEEARLKAEQEAAEEAARLKAEQDAAEAEARLKAAQEEAEEEARLQAEQEAAEEEARLKAEQEAAEEAARLQAEQEATEEQARIEAEEEAARLEAVAEENGSDDGGDDDGGGGGGDKGDDFTEEMGEMSLEDVFDDNGADEPNRKIRDKSFDESWSEITTGQRGSKPRKSSVEASPVPKGLVKRIVSGQGQEKSPNSLLSPRKVQEELNKSVTKGLVKERLTSAKKRESTVPSLFSPFDF